MRWGLGVILAMAGWAVAPTTFGVAGLSLELELVANGLGKGVSVTHAGDDRLFVVDKSGYIRIVRADGSVASTPFLNVSSKVSQSVGEGGLLGLAFHPNYQNNGYFYIHYTQGENSSGLHSVIARYRVSNSNPDRADAGSESRLLRLPQPASNHNGGDLAFSPNDGYLYITLGDGGGAGDTHGNGQNKRTPLGAVLRIDVDSKGTNRPSECYGSGNGQYKVPTNNPLRDGAGGNCDEIWAYGLRNPFRFSFDRQNGDLYIGDVGQGAREEVNFQPGGSPGGVNYGWRCYEGDATYNLGGCGSAGQYTRPFFDYNRTTTQRSVIGGFTYRGSRYDKLKGVYLFNDYFSTKIWAADTVNGNWTVTTYNVLPRSRFAGWGEDVDGELYLVNQSDGSLYHLTEADGTAPPPPPPPTNEAPVITQGGSIARTMDEDGAPTDFSVNLGATDDAALSQLTWRLKTQAGNGSASVSGNGGSPTVDYQPNANWSGSDSFVAQVVDAGGLVDNIRVDVTVRPRNDAPTNTTQPSISGNAEVGEVLTANRGQWHDNKDAPSGNLSYTYQWQRATNASGGNLSNISGATDDTYTVRAADAERFLRVKVVAEDDGTGLPATASRTAYSDYVEVAPEVAQPPVIAQGGSVAVTMDEDASPQGFAVSLSATDDGPANALSWSLFSEPSHGSATVSGTGSSPNVRYEPDQDWSGNDSFEVRVRDGDSQRDTIRVNVTVRPRNDAPSNTAVPSISGEPLVGQTLNGLRGTWNDDLDTAPGSLTYQYRWQRADSGSGAGASNISGATGANYLTVNADQDKYLRFKVIAKDDGEGLPASQQTTAVSGWVKITTTPNAAPVIQQGGSTNVSMDEDGSPTAFAVTLSASDDGPANQLTWSLAGAAEHGTASVTGTGASPTVSYSPHNHYNGNDSFVVQVSDDNGRTDQITVNVTLRPRNDPPRNTRLPVINGEPEINTRLTLDRGDWNDNRDRQPGNLAYTYRWQVADSATGNGLQNISGEAGLTFDVPSNFAGRWVRVHVTVRDDGEGLPNVRSVVRDTEFVQIRAPAPVSEAPVITQGANTSVVMDEDASPTPFELELRATDDDGSAGLRWSLRSPPAHGSATASGSGARLSVDYEPEPDFNGSDRFEVEVRDQAGNTDWIRVNVTVRPRNDAPINIERPAATGAGEVGALLTAHEGLWQDDRDQEPGDITYRYHWQRSDSNGRRFAHIPDAESKTYEVTQADAGKAVRVKVIATSWGEGAPRGKSKHALSAPIAIDGAVIVPDAIFRGGFE